MCQYVCACVVFLPCLACVYVTTSMLHAHGYILTHRYPRSRFGFFLHKCVFWCCSKLRAFQPLSDKSASKKTKESRVAKCMNRFFFIRLGSGNCPELLTAAAASLGADADTAFGSLGSAVSQRAACIRSMVNVLNAARIAFSAFWRKVRISTTETGPRMVNLVVTCPKPDFA